jgi:uncharacterized RDD family membrane protein YckC
VQAPPDSQCAYHPGTLATNICGRCGTFICVVCSTHSGSGGVFCPRCQTPTLQRASRGTRFVANLVDSFVVMAPTFVLLFVGVAVMAAVEKGGTGSDLAALAMMAGMFLGFGVGLAAQIVMQLKYGQSVGKRLFRIKVVRTDGSPVELWRIILLRNLALHVAAQLCGLIGLVDALMIFGADERCLHDLIAETIVIDVSGEG